MRKLTFNRKTKKYFRRFVNSFSADMDDFFSENAASVKKFTGKKVPVYISTAGDNLKSAGFRAGKTAGTTFKTIRERVPEVKAAVSRNCSGVNKFVYENYPKVQKACIKAGDNAGKIFTDSRTKFKKMSF